MAVITTFVDDTTDSGVSIDADLIPLFVANFEYIMPVGMNLAWVTPGQGLVPRRFGRWGALSQAPASKTESDQWAETDATQAESSITPAIIGVRAFISDEAMSSVGNSSVPTGFLSQLMLALIDQMDSTILGASSSATNTAGSVTRDYTLSEFRSDIRAFKALHVGAGAKALTLHSNGMSDLLGSMHDSSATKVTSTGDSAELTSEQGYQNTLHGFQLWESDNCPVESTGHSGLMTPVGPGLSAYGAVVNRMPSIVPTRGDDAESRAGTYFNATSFYGAGMTNPNKCLEVLHQ